MSEGLKLLPGLGGRHLTASQQSWPRTAPRSGSVLGGVKGNLLTPVGTAGQVEAAPGCDITM